MYILRALEILILKLMVQLNFNVGAAERVLSVFAGALLLLQAISKQKVDASRSAAATYLLLRGVTGFCPFYQAIGKTDIGRKAQNVNIRMSMTVDRPRHQVYAAWRKLEDLPRFMKHLRSVRQLDHEHSAWEAHIPGGMGTISWKSHIVKDDPGSLLSWQSLPGSTVVNAGKIEFRDAGDTGTEIHVTISYHAPLGHVGETAARWLNPLFEKMVTEDVVDFKRYMETREISVADDQSTGIQTAR